MLGSSNWNPSFHALLARDYGLQSRVAKHLSISYGTRSLRILDDAQAQQQQTQQTLSSFTPLSPSHPYLEAEVQYAAKYEYAQTITDVIARRTRLAFLDHESAVNSVPRVAELMAPILGWQEQRKQEEIQRAYTYLETMKVNDMK